MFKGFENMLVTKQERPIIPLQLI